MLKDHFYTVTALSHQDNTIQAVLQLNSKHEIFAGHFPGQPVVPGACMLQMVKEILGEAKCSAYKLKKGDNLKFIAPIDPLMTPEVELKLTYKTMDAGLQVTAMLSANEVICFKFQGIFITT